MLQLFQLPPLVGTGIGIILVITLYNVLKLRFSPGLPCMIVVMMCIEPEESPVLYATGRVWDTAIGLTVGMVINMLVFPYDNSRQIRNTAESLDRELILFLENMFDGDDILPDAEVMSQKISDMENQLRIFSKQKLFWRLRSQKKELSKFRIFESKARSLVAQMEVLSRLEAAGRLSNDNRQRLLECGAQIRDERQIDTQTELDTVTNYHVSKVLTLRFELMEILKK